MFFSKLFGKKKSLTPSRSSSAGPGEDLPMDERQPEGGHASGGAKTSAHGKGPSRLNKKKGIGRASAKKKSKRAR